VDADAPTPGEGDDLQPIERLLLRRETVAAMLDISVRGVDRLGSLGELRRIPVLGTSRIPYADVIDYVRRQALLAESTAAADEEAS